MIIPKQLTFTVQAIKFQSTFLSRYRSQVFESTQKIFKLGIEKHETRLENITEFNEAIEEGAKDTQMEGIRLVITYKNFTKRCSYGIES